MRSALLVAVTLFCSVAVADQGEQPEPENKYHPIAGPKDVDLGHDIQFKLPEGLAFFAEKDAVELLKESGNFFTEGVLGIAVNPESHWSVVFTYVEEGYVKDDEADKLDAKEILDAMREGAVEENKQRKEKGFPELSVDGWKEEPKYDKANHNLVWALKVSDPTGSSVNYNTRILGRKGYVSVNFVTDEAMFEENRKAAPAILAATSFKPGARYADFDAKTDKVAEYGLLALVAGGAGAAALKLAKAGILVKFGTKILAFLMIAKKGVVVFIIGIWAAVKRFFRKKETPTPVAAAPAAAEPPVDPDPTPTDPPAT